MFVKVLQGNAAAADTLQLGYSERQEVVDAAFTFLTEPRSWPAMVAGDLGVGLPTVHVYIHEHALQEKVQTHGINRQTFHTLFYSAKPEYQCTSIITNSPRMLLHQDQINSGDQHPTAEAKPLTERALLTPPDPYEETSATDGWRWIDSPRQ